MLSNQRQFKAMEMLHALETHLKGWFSAFVADFYTSTQNWFSLSFIRQLMQASLILWCFAESMVEKQFFIIIISSRS